MSESDVTRLVAPPPDRLSGLAALAFGSGSVGALEGKHLAFLPLESLELDLSDPEQCDFGDYELIEQLGQGGMGVVYRARQRSLQREVALKLLSAGPWASPAFIARFQREAQAAARLQHPNIVPIYEIGQHAELNFFSMALIRGRSLAQRLDAAGPLPPLEAAALVRRIAEALDYAHRLGILHLDLKPANVLVDEHGEPQVADFGLAKRLDESLASDSDEVSGTPSYMAPEQATARSQGIGVATDIYGLGAILYELLCARPPFLGATPRQTLEQVVGHAVEPPSSHRRGLPRDLDAICLRCLAKVPEQRYASARALAEDLGRFLEGRAVSVRPLHAGQRLARWVRREPRLAFAAAAFVLALALGLIATAQQWRRAEGHAQAARALLWESRREAALRLEQDGRGLQALPRLVDNLREQERAGAEAAVALERRRIGMLLAGGARLVDRMLVPGAVPLATAVSPDGARVALAFADLSVRWYDTGTLREQGRVSLAGLPTSDGQARAPILLRFAAPARLRVTLEWYTNMVNPGAGDTWLVDLDRAEVLAPPPIAGFSDASYSGDGSLALLRDREGGVQLWQVGAPWHARSPRHADPNPFQTWLPARDGRRAYSLEMGRRALRVHHLPSFAVAHRIEVPHGSGVSSWSLSADERLLAFGDMEGRVYLLDTERGTLRAVASGRGREILWLAFSEDDAWLASANFDGAVQAFDVASGDALAAGQMRHDFPVQRIGLSRAQRLLVVAGAGQTALWRLSQHGARALPPHRIGLVPAPHAAAGRYPVGWSFDNGLLATAGMDGQLRLWRMPAAPTLAAGAPRQLPEGFSPVASLVEAAGARLRVVRSDGRDAGPWLELPHAPGFAELLDRDRLLLVTLGAQLHFFDAVTLRPRQPALALPASPQRLLANRDGSRVVLSFGVHGAQGLEDRLRVVDAHAAAFRAGEASVAGPLAHLAWSADERRVLAVGGETGRSVVLDADTLAPAGEFAHDAFEPVVWGAWRGDEVWLATRAGDRRLGSDRVLRWTPATDAVEDAIETGSARPLGLQATPGAMFLLGADLDLRLPAKAGPSPLPRLARSEASARAAVSPDGRLLARLHRHEVQLFDAASGEPVGPPLTSDSHPLDFIALLAFDPAGDALLARTLHGRWLRWPIAPEARPTAALDDFLAVVTVAQQGQAVMHPPAPSERRGLRAADPGAWRSPPPPPPPSLAPGTAATLGIPVRSAGLDPRLVDLAAAYDTGPDSLGSAYYGFRPGPRVYPVGVQHIGGVAFDVRGQVHVGHPRWESAPGAAPARPLRCLALPALPSFALHLLTDVTLPRAVARGTPIASVTLHYQDGGSATLPLRAGEELPGHDGDDGAVPVTFAPNAVLPASGYRVEGLVTPRLALPEPGRALRCLDLETHLPSAVLGLFALTLQAPPAVIAGPDGGTAIVPVPPAAPFPPRRSP